MDDKGYWKKIRIQERKLINDAKKAKDNDETYGQYRTRQLIQDMWPEGKAKDKMKKC